MIYVTCKVANKNNNCVKIEVNVWLDADKKMNSEKFRKFQQIAEFVDVLFLIILSLLVYKWFNIWFMNVCTYSTVQMDATKSCISKGTFNCFNSEIFLKNGCQIKEKVCFSIYS